MSYENGRLKAWSSATYVIEVEGLLEKTWSDHFAGMRITNRKREDGSCHTRLTGFITDQSELAGVLNGLFEFNLPILRLAVIDGAGRMPKPVRTN